MRPLYKNNKIYELTNNNLITVGIEVLDSEHSEECRY